MKKTEKEALLSRLEKESDGDWDTYFNMGRTDGLKKAIEIVQAMPEDPEMEIEDLKTQLAMAEQRNQAQEALINNLEDQLTQLKK